jgi:uncharacterized membrane protein
MTTTDMNRATDTHAAPADVRALRVTDRYWEVDALRGVAIVLMVSFHFMYNLSYFGDDIVDLGTTGWRNFSHFIAALFVGLVGISLTISVARTARRTDDEAQLFRKVALRGLRILGYAMIITLVVRLAAPQGWILFGILHLIGLSIILAYPFLRRPWLALGTGIVAIALGQIVREITLDHPYLLWLGIRSPGMFMFDYRPLLPWFGVALVGIFLGHLLYPGGARRFTLPWPSPRAGLGALSTLGRYSLPIYVIHQPVLLVTLDLLGIIDLGLF